MRTSALLVLLTAAAALADSPKRAQAEEHALKAQELFKLNRLPDAESEFKAAAAIDPTWNEIWFNLGVVYEAMGRSADAAAALRAYLPYAQKEEVAQLRQKIAQLEIRADDERKAAAQKEAADRAAAEQARTRAEHDAQQRAATEAVTDARRVLVVDNVEQPEHVTIKDASGKEVACPVDRVTELGQCRLKLPSGNATVRWGGKHEVGFFVPEGSNKLTLKTSDWLPLIVGIVGLVSGAVLTGVFAATGSFNKSGGAGIAVCMGLLGAAGIAGLVIGFNTLSDRVSVEPYEDEEPATAK